MSTRKLILYIATSADGYIAKENNDISFLTELQTPPGEDYGYAEFTSTVDTVIMGRKTYDKVLSFGVEFPHKGRKCYVLSRTRQGSDENVEYYHGDIGELLQRIRQQEGKHIYCDGGADVVTELLQHGLIDTLVISIIPHLLGSGIRLFADGRPEQKLRLQKACSFSSGLVQMWYECVG